VGGDLPQDERVCLWERDKSCCSPFSTNRLLKGIGERRRPSMNKTTPFIIHPKWEELCGSNVNWLVQEWRVASIHWKWPTIGASKER
jgi:hypothetical protein